VLPETNKPIRVEIVTPVFNRKDLTLLCLRSIKRLRTDGIEIHVLIVDDGSTDGTFEAVSREFPDVEIVKGNGNLWFTEGTNVGVRAALKHDPDFVLMINNDQVFDDRSLEFMVETALANERSVVGPLLLLWDQPHKIFQVAPQWSTKLGGWRHWYKQTVWSVPDRPWEVDLIVGNCVLVPVAAIEEHGLMNSERYPNFGDAEYTPRLKKHGWKLLIDPRARVFCQPNDMPASASKMSLKEKAEALFVDLKKVQNLRRRFYFYWDSAPSKLQAILGYIVFFARYAAGKNIESSWAAGLPEVPLAEMESRKRSG
jgi:GT2 family glycosyltransferase